ncbi:MAG: hypothetical protein AAFR36_31175 [Bacteroidota bacterium]
MPKHVQTAELAVRIRFHNNEEIQTWYQRVEDPEDQITIWKTYPVGRYRGRIKWMAILPADAARQNAGADTHLHEYGTWPNGSTSWLSREEIAQLQAVKQ